MFGYEERAGANTRLQDREGEAVLEARGIPPSTYILPILGSSALRQRGAIFFCGRLLGSAVGRDRALAWRR